MPTLDKIVPDAAPRATVTLSPTDFTDRGVRPSGDMIVGLRILSVSDRKEIMKWVPQFVKDYGIGQNECELRLCVASSICDANDVTKPFRLFTRTQDQVFTDLTFSGAKKIFDAILKLDVETSVGFPEATPHDIEALYVLIEEGALEILKASDYSSVLRHLRFALDIIREAEEVDDPELRDDLYS